MNMLTRIPALRVTAKPRIGPEPCQNRMTAGVRVGVGVGFGVGVGVGVRVREGTGEGVGVDGVVKATGEARYTGDMVLPRMLCGKILRSPYPHARILKIDTSSFKARSVKDRNFAQRLSSVAHCCDYNIFGKANGITTVVKIFHSDAPRVCAALIKSLLTFLMPVTVL